MNYNAENSRMQNDNNVSTRSLHTMRPMHYTVYMALMVSNLAVFTLAILFMNEFSAALGYFEQMRQEYILTAGQSWAASLPGGGDILDFARKKQLPHGRPGMPCSECAPQSSFNSANQKSDGSGSARISIEVSDQNGDDAIAQIHFYPTQCSAGGTMVNATLAGPAIADYNDSGGPPDINNASIFQVGSGVDTRIVTAADSQPISNTVDFDWDALADSPSANGPYCLQLITKDLSSANLQSATTTIDLTIDHVNPTPPGNLSYDCITDTSILLTFGAQSSDTNFHRYEIYYRQATSTVTENDKKVGSILGADYGGKKTYTVTGLQSDSDYVFNIWAYDEFCKGNVASCVYNKNKAVAELSVHTRPLNPWPYNPVTCPENSVSSMNPFGNIYGLAGWSENRSGQQEMYYCANSSSNQDDKCYDAVNPKVQLTTNSPDTWKKDIFRTYYGWAGIMVWQSINPTSGKSDLYYCKTTDPSNWQEFTGCRASDPKIRITASSSSANNRDHVIGGYIVWELSQYGSYKLAWCDPLASDPGLRPRACNQTSESPVMFTQSTYGQYNPDRRSIMVWSEKMQKAGGGYVAAVRRCDPNSGCEGRPYNGCCDLEHINNPIIRTVATTTIPVSSSGNEGDKIKPRTDGWNIVWLDEPAEDGYFTKLYHCVTLYGDTSPGNCGSNDTKHLIQSGTLMKDVQIRFSRIFWVEKEPDGQISYVMCNLNYDGTPGQCTDGTPKNYFMTNMHHSSTPLFYGSGVDWEVFFQHPINNEWDVYHERFEGNHP